MHEDDQPTVQAADQLNAFLVTRMRQKPTVTLAALRAAGRRAGYVVRRREYDEARRIAGLSSGAPLPPAARSGAAKTHAPRGDNGGGRAADGSVATARDTELPRTPSAGGADAATPAASGVRLAVWMTAWIRSHPAALFAEARAAAAVAGYEVKRAGGFGVIRKLLGLPSNARGTVAAAMAAGRRTEGAAMGMSARAPRRGAARSPSPVAENPTRTAVARAPAPGRRPRRRDAASAAVNVAAALESLRDVLGERDQLRAALEGIAAVLEAAGIGATGQRRWPRVSPSTMGTPCGEMRR